MVRSAISVESMGQGRYALYFGDVKANVYALDAQTGKELWNSGNQIPMWNHWSGIAVANGKIYINTFDGELYCFGLKK